MMQILIWGVAAMLLLLGLLIVQVGITAPEERKSNAQFVSTTALLFAMAAAALFVFLAQEQAASVSSLGL